MNLGYIDPAGSGSGFPVGLVVYVVAAFAFAGFSAWIASQKGRNSNLWFVLGLVFSLLALIAIAAVPSKKEERRAHQE